MGKFGKGDLYGILSLKDYMAKASAEAVQGAAAGGLQDLSTCNWDMGMYGQFYVMVIGVPMFMASFSLLLLRYENQRKDHQTQMEINAIYDEHAPPPPSETTKKSWWQKIPALEHKIEESNRAQKLDYFSQPTTHMVATDEDGDGEKEFNPEGMWWLVSSLTLHKGLRHIGLNRTVVEIAKRG